MNQRVYRKGKQMKKRHNLFSISRWDKLEAMGINHSHKSFRLDIRSRFLILRVVTLKLDLQGGMAHWEAFGTGDL